MRQSEITDIRGVMARAEAIARARGSSTVEIADVLAATDGEPATEAPARRSWRRMRKSPAVKAALTRCLGTGGTVSALRNALQHEQAH